MRDSPVTRDTVETPPLPTLFQFLWLSPGFRNDTLHTQGAQPMSLSPANYTLGRLTYDLCRLRLLCTIIKIPGRHRYQLIDEGIRICLFLIKVHGCIIRPDFLQLMDVCTKAPDRPIANAKSFGNLLPRQPLMYHLFV